MRILFSQSYFRIFDPKEMQRQMPYPPLGTLIAATLARNQGHNVQCVDGMMASSLEAFDRSVEEFRPELVVIYDDEFNYLTKMCLSNMRHAAFHMIRKAKSLKVPVIVYSSDATDHTPIYLFEGSHAIIVGEGENTLMETVAAFSNECFETAKHSINGLKFLDSGQLHATPKREWIDDLDSLPDPDLTMIDIAAYHKLWLKYHGYFSLNISTTRGCPYHCNWCAKPIYGQIYHTQSPAKTVQQLLKLKNNYHADHVWITDDIFGLKPGWLELFESECKKQNIVVPYKCLTRADLLLKTNTINHLKNSGCRTIWIGAESGSQKILDAMEKGTRIEQIYEATDKVQKAGIEVAFFIQFGYTGETWPDIQLTRKMIRECLPAEIGISVSYPLPGTKFYERVRDQLRHKSNWTDSDDLDLMFNNTYEKAFYKILHRFVHAEYRLHRIIKQRQWKKMPRAVYHFLRFCFFKIRLIPYYKHA
ncbi:B12-binding domain-containing radical SAM protein [bacterium]|nr:B12-binding domain-containing radical SAM protein [bacterium]